MSVMKLTPIYKCRFAGCGRALAVTHLSTAQPDPDTVQLRTLMTGLGKIALCRDHLLQSIWYASQDRSPEFEQMAAGAGLLIAVRDPEKDQEYATP